MSGYPAAEGSHSPESAQSVSVPIVVAVALLCGVGILGVAYWLYTYNWLYFASIIPLIGGAYLLFTRLTGPERA